MGWYLGHDDIHANNYSYDGPSNGFNFYFEWLKSNILCNSNRHGVKRNTRDKIKKLYICKIKNKNKILGTKKITTIKTKNGIIAKIKTEKY